MRELSWVNLEGQAGWRDKMVDGMRLAPPHDKSGHTWHHPGALLFKLTKYGFAAMISSDYQVSMPIYDDVLKDEEMAPPCHISNRHGQMMSGKSKIKSMLITS